MECLEIEIKAYCDNLTAVIDKLGALGARRIGSIRECDQYMNHPSRDFGVTDEALRLRKANDESVMTYKGPKIGLVSKTRREEEVEVADFDAALGILESLGFSRAGSVEKERERFILEGIEVCLDRVEGLGDFVELEIKGEDREAAEALLFGLAEKLGLRRFERRSYLELKFLGAGE